MGRIKAVNRSKPHSRGHAPKSNLLVRPNASIQRVENVKSQTQAKEKVDTPDTTAETQLPAESHYAQNYPTPESSIDDIIEVKARIRQSTRKKYPSDVPRPSRPPFLPQAMQTGCIQISKFKCLTAPTATDGKPDWDAIKYCLDCLRPHLILRCDGSRSLVSQECVFHKANPDGTLRVNEYDRVRKRLEGMFFKHGTMDSRPFTPPLLEHYPGCGHQSEWDGFSPELVADLKETARWNKDGDHGQMHAAAQLKVDTPQKNLPGPATPRSIPSYEDAIMIDD